MIFTITSSIRNLLWICGTISVTIANLKFGTQFQWRWSCFLHNDNLEVFKPLQRSSSCVAISFNNGVYLRTECTGHMLLILSTISGINSSRPWPVDLIFMKKLCQKYSTTTSFISHIEYCVIHGSIDVT